MRLLTHILVVGSILFGGDVFFNNGNETRSMMFDSRRAVTTEIKLKAYHFATFVERKVDLLVPTD